MISLDRFGANYHTHDDLSSRICYSNKAVRENDDVYMWYIHMLFILFCANKHNQNATRSENKLSSKTL